MSNNRLDYDSLVRAAMLDVVRKALKSVAVAGLPEENEIFIGFRTSAPGVEVPDFVLEQYPDEVTIALRRSFWDLEVDDDGFRVALVFSGARTRIFVPFAALLSFVDPKVQFALAFEPRKTAGTGVDQPPQPTEPPASVPPPPSGSSNVVRFQRRGGRK